MAKRFTMPHNLTPIAALVIYLEYQCHEDTIKNTYCIKSPYNSSNAFPSLQTSIWIDFILFQAFLKFQMYDHILWITFQPWIKILDKISQVICLLGDVPVILTLNMRGPNYLGLTGSISLLMMLWLLSSPAYQQQWYWLCRIGSSLSWGKISTTCVISMWWNDIKFKYVFVPSEKFST